MSTTGAFWAQSGTSPPRRTRRRGDPRSYVTLHPTLVGVLVVELTQGQRALIDETDVERVGRHIWRAVWSPCTKTFYAETRGLIMHRLILDLEAGNPLTGDHITHDTLDNRRTNLRTATTRENKRNRLKGGGTSKFKGVSWDRERGRWHAEIKMDGRRIWLGRYATAEAAAMAYDLAALKYHGDYALTNAMLGLIVAERIGAGDVRATGSER